jgi:uncharacterized phage protein (TIGR01671 family)
MREIKFRIYYPYPEGGEMVNDIWIDLKRGMLWADNDALCVRRGLEEAVLMRFTGLKDKKGKEIYEGDIVKTLWRHDDGWSYELSGVIFWNNDDLSFSLDCSDQIIRFIASCERETLEEIEIIGNICENKELLKDSI